ncbi:MAG TPA: penicillin-binding protein 1C [Candidatus Tectomicrobia bacterium]|nr:penicillin-binding protein 1C [Candidatus Tectomicrobia bacterium]
MTRRPLLALFLCMVAAAAGALWLTGIEGHRTLPSLAEVRGLFRPSDVSLLDRSGRILHERRLDPHGRRLAWTALSDISPALQSAVVASEDRRFYRHGGVDGLAMLAAVTRTLLGQRPRGASTISMQLVTLIDPAIRSRGLPRTIMQKWRQMWLAWTLEHRWSKPEILEAYLNLASYRGELQGIAAASNLLLGKAPHGITEPEAAVLAVLLRGPNAEPETVARRAWALQQTRRESTPRQDISAAVDRALKNPAGTGPRVALAPHAAQRLLPAIAAHAPVPSTLDRELQEFAIDALRRHLMAVRRQRVYDGAILVAENQTGDILAYVAGSGDLSSARYVDGIQARRQTGSILKPFLYAMALEQKILTPASLLEDAPLDVPVPGGLYRPRNYDEQFRGLVSVRTALAASLNIPAVRALALVGAEAFVQQLRRLGLEGAIEAGHYYGPSLALGSVDASLWELVQAYRTLANGGMLTPLRLTPKEPDGPPGRRVYAPATAFLLSHILSDRDSRSVTFDLESPLATRFWSAVKTGTSKEMRDNWCIGYTGKYTVGVWVGNLSGEPMRNVSGVTGAAPVWGEIVAWLHRTTPSLPMAEPVGVVQRLAIFSDGVEPERQEWFLQGTEPPPLATKLAVGLSRVRTPAAGEVIGLDPDIPAAHQRVLFAADGAGSGHRWVLNGQDLGPVVGPLLWKPVPGEYRLSLVGPDGRALDMVSFEVRPGVTTVGAAPSRQR